MKPADIAHLTAISTPAFTADASIIVAISQPDLEANTYRSHLVRVSGETVDDFTHGEQDGSPVASPDGTVIVFTRADTDKRGQLHAIRTDGGDARQLCSHPLGAQEVVFSPDGSHIAYTAGIPEADRYGTNDEIDAGAEAPRRITSLYYRRDGAGYTRDKPSQIFVLELVPGAKPRQVTAEPGGAGDLAWSTDGKQLYYARPQNLNALNDEIAVIDADAEKSCGTRAFTGPADSGRPTAAADGSIYLFGSDFQGNDFAGRSLGLWRYDAERGCHRLTDPETVHLDRSAGPVVVQDNRLLIAVENRGAVEIRALPVGTSGQLRLDELEVVLDGKRVVKSFASNGSEIAAVVADTNSPSELVLLSGHTERICTDYGSAVRDTGIRPLIELTGTAPDGYPVHGWLLLPEGDGPHPVLLNVHGGPHTQYGWSLFDEAQVYASAGYAVVMGNPRGSSGYGQQHGRAIVQDMGNLDTADVLCLLEVALTRDDCDANRVGVMGGSYGGYMTSHLMAAAGDRFVAGISERALNAWDSFAGSSDIGDAFTVAYVSADREEQWRRSPLAAADQINRPLLIVHSENDWRCPLEQGQRLFTALQRRQAPVEMLLFPGEGHELSRSGRPQHRVQRFEAILQWWSRYLPVHPESS